MAPSFIWLSRIVRSTQAVGSKSRVATQTSRAKIKTKLLIFSSSLVSIDHHRQSNDDFDFLFAQGWVILLWEIEAENYSRQFVVFQAQSTLSTVSGESCESDHFWQWRHHYRGVGQFLAPVWLLGLYTYMILNIDIKARRFPSKKYTNSMCLKLARSFHNCRGQRS